MSSTYRFLCLSHDPSITVGAEDGYTSVDEAVSALDTMLGDHTECDVVLGRYSYPLVEVGCLGGRRPGHGASYHVEVQWTDADWLRLAAAAAAAVDEGGAVAAAVEAVTARCWTRDRLHRLRNAL